MKIDLTQFRQTFLQESADHVANMESGLLALRSNPGDDEILNAVFRSAHSIKGGAGSFGLENLARFTHGLESLLERLRARELELTEEVVALLLASVDVLRVLLDPEAPLPENALELQRRIDETASGDATLRTPPLDLASAAADAPPQEPAGPLALYRIEFRPDHEIFSSGANPIVLLRNLAGLGDVTVTHLDASDLPSLADLDSEQCYLAWTVEIATSRPETELREIFEFVEHLAEISIRRLEDARPPVAEPEEVRAVPVAPADSTVATPAPVPARPSAKRPATRSASGGESASIRVATEKVDRLIDLVGELVIAHVMTAQMVETFTPECLPRLRESVAAMERNTRELHERVMAVRMLPVGTLFQRYTRTVYDIAQATGKQIELVMAGEDTEVDKSMLEMLGDPLTHLIRNSADHGIEVPEARVAQGKPGQGTISLRAFHRSGRVVIEVADDGAGIDPARVRARAVERGLIAADAQMSDEQIRMLIFEPGFSTRDTVSEFSGRGVGLDVVLQNVRKLNGSVALASEIGRGATVTIELPLTLAILEGLLVRVADRTLVLPLLSVVETVSPRAGQIQRVAEQGDVILIRNESIPLLRLRRYLGLETDTGAANPAPPAAQAPEVAPEVDPASDSASRTLIVVVEAGRKKIGLAVDALLGQQQVVVKSLERHLRKVDGLMGATILGDGCVAPIVDVAGLAGMNLYALDQALRGLTAPPPQSSEQVSPATGERGESANAMV